MLFAPIFFGTSNISYSLPNSLYIGDDYSISLDNTFTFDFIPPIGAVIGNCSVVFSGSHMGDSGTTWSVSGTLSDNGNGTWKATFELLSVVTSTLLYGHYNWYVSFTNISDTTTIFSGTGLLWQLHTVPTCNCG